jgi:hypothetical protein
MRPGMPTIPDFTSRAWQEGVSDAQLAASMLEGKGQLMPSFTGRVTPDQARDLVAFVRALGPAPAQPSQGPSSDFEKRYRELQEQWEELEKQLRRLDRPPAK